MTSKRYTIIEQISSTPLKGTNNRLEVYKVTSAHGVQNNIGIITPGYEKKFSRPINSQINFRPASYINGVLFEQKIR